MKVFGFFIVSLILCCCMNLNIVNSSSSDSLIDEYDEHSSQPLMVPLTLIPSAASKGAVCLDGTVPGYHLHRGEVSGPNSWLIQLEGGGWCDTVKNCIYRKKSRRGSSAYMEKQLLFTGILSNRSDENPDFFNWNRVIVRYCDGASFSGDSHNEAANLNFRGQKIWLAAMEELMDQGMASANQVLLSGCSAGGLASILHCDEFSAMFSKDVKVKCLSDAGLFLDVLDVAGNRTLRNMFAGVVSLQHVGKNLPESCLNHSDPTSCFFPQNLIANVTTPLFLLNAAYDSWQIVSSLTTSAADPTGSWKPCKLNHTNCNMSQILFLQDFRRQMIRALLDFAKNSQNGVFLNSCFAHCQTEKQDTWFANDAPRIRNMGIAESVGNWYFERKGQKLTLDCPYPCDQTCHNQIMNDWGILRPVYRDRRKS